MRIRSWGVALIALALAGFSMRASATLVTLPVIGGQGMDQGEMCLVGPLCPGNPVLTLGGNAAVTGSFVFNDVANTVDISLTLTANASFGGLVFGAGTTFAATGVPVMKIPLGGGAYEIVQAGAASGSVGVVPLGFLAPLSSAPDVSGLTCLVNTGADQCGFSLGPGGYQVVDTSSSTPLQVFQTFNVNVPEPATFGLLGLGTGALVWVARRRNA
jgi:hypothetical protein